MTPSSPSAPPPTRAQRRARPHTRSGVAAFVAVALAVAPVSHPPFVSLASAQTATDSSELRKYGSVPSAPPSVPALPDSADIQKYGSIGGPAVPLSPSQKLPDLGDSSQSIMSPTQERKLGELIMRQIRGGGGYLEDAEVNDYLNELGNRLVTATRDVKQDFVFFAVPDQAINAFALPGGFVGVNTGLVLLAQNESQLASVLAHEISHVTQHHITRGMASQQNVLLTTLAGLAVAILASKAGGSSSNQAMSAAIAGTQALAAQQQINFTRENEFEADRVGFTRLVSAGFDPNAMGEFFDRLQRSSRFVEGNVPSYLRDHPVTYERIAEAKSRAQDLPYKQVRDSLDFHLVRALLQSYQGDAREQAANFSRNIAEKKFNNEIAERYGLVASLLRAKEIPRAKEALVQLEKVAPPHPMVEAMAGHVLMESGKLDQAIDRFKSALARYPNKMQLIYDYPQALVKAGRLREAAAFLETELARYPGDGPLHRIAARTYADLGTKQQEHRHQGEFYAWQGDYKEAVRQFELASKANDGDFYQSSVIEARLRALRKELTEQVALGKNG